MECLDRFLIVQHPLFIDRETRPVTHSLATLGDKIVFVTRQPLSGTGFDGVPSGQARAHRGSRQGNDGGSLRQRVDGGECTSKTRALDGGSTQRQNSQIVSFCNSWQYLNVGVSQSGSQYFYLVRGGSAHQYQRAPSFVRNPNKKLIPVWMKFAK